MMLAVMYGMMPSANTVSCRSAPPEKTLISANRLLFSPCGRDLDALTHVGDVDAGRRHGGAEPEQHDDAEHEEDLLAQVRCPERVGEGAEHVPVLLGP